ncbi:MAG: ABC transporter ATP-binding protein [Acidobacteriota bacterium]
METELIFTDIYRSFGRLRVLRGLSGAARGGELLLVTGRNGSGKSTLLRCLAGLMRPQRGEIHCRVNGRALDAAERRRAVGFLSPELELYGELTTLENLEFFATLRAVPDGRERGRALLERLGLPTERPARALSSGMRQRLRLAWALLHRPQVLLFDEPMQNLDQPGRSDVKALLGEHLEAGGLAVVANPDRLDLPKVDGHVELAA